MQLDNSPSDSRIPISSNGISRPPITNRARQLPSIPFAAFEESTDSSSADLDPYIRLAAAVFLQAVSDYLSLLKAVEKHRQLKRRELQEAISAVDWLRGRSAGGVTLKIAADAMHLDVAQLFAAPHQYVVLQMRARKSGRRRREDYA